MRGHRGDTVGHMQVLPRGMAADVHKKKSWEVPNGSLAPGDGQHTERSESPTPGLAHGTEPGMEHSSPGGKEQLLMWAGTSTALWAGGDGPTPDSPQARPSPP